MAKVCLFSFLLIYFFDQWLITDDHLKGEEAQIKSEKGSGGRAAEQVDRGKRAGSAKAEGSRMVKSNRGEQQEIRG